MNESRSAFSLGRLLILLLPVAGIALAVNYQVVNGLERAAQAELETNMLSRLLGDTLLTPVDTVTFSDADGDLVNDAPSDENCQTPEKLVFSYIASSETEDGEAVWGDLVAAIAEATGLPVEFQHYNTVNEQLSAMARGELHISGLNTGATPTAVGSAGFVPVCTLGHDDGTYGYTMKLITSAESGIESPADVEGKKFAFTRPNSNSGFKAALVFLMTDQGLQPERDYDWGFTYDHKTSIQEVAAGQHAAAAVASDILQGMINEGEVSDDALRIIYESERFPPAVIGYAHNLPTALRNQIEETLLAFDWSGTGVEEKFGSMGVSKFVAVSYKDDWANIRRIDEAVRSAKATQPTY